MKKLIVTFAFVLAAQVGFAQDAAFKNDVKKVIEMTGASAQIDVAKKQILGMIPEAKQAAFLKDFAATMPSKFYETPLGKKITSKAGVLTEKTMEAAQAWGVELQNIMMKYMQ